MKKIAITLFCIMTLPVVINASGPEAKVTGDWYSTPATNVTGGSSVGTTNTYGTTETFDFILKDVDGGVIDWATYNVTLSDNQSYNSGIQNTNALNLIQGQVLVDDNATTHTPWFNSL